MPVHQPKGAEVAVPGALPEVAVPGALPEVAVPVHQPPPAAVRPAGRGAHAAGYLDGRRVGIPLTGLGTVSRRD